MKNIKFIALFLFFIAFQGLNAQKALKLTQYFIEYTVKNAGIKSTGRFDEVNAAVVFDENNLAESSISANILTRSFNSSMALRDKHLKGEEYFDAEHFPNISLVSTKISKTTNGYIGDFNLTIKGTTKAIKLNFTVVQKGNTYDFKSSDLIINRLDYGVGKSSMTLSNTVKLSLNATFTN
jgi:polyisoprenoid-binding protein YceI